MKRNYQKPYLALESFQLNAAIATSCSGSGKSPINYAWATCAYDDSSLTPVDVYLGSTCAIDIFRPGGDGNDTICYQGPFSPSDFFLQS